VGTFQDLREVVKNLKHRRETQKYCPRCGSPRLKLADGADFWLNPGKFVCQDCGYRGFIVMEKDEYQPARGNTDQRATTKNEIDQDYGKSEEDA